MSRKSPVVIVTGACGFTGSELVKELCERKFQVVATDLVERPDSIDSRAFFVPCNILEGFEKVVREAEKLGELKSVFHVAALVPYNAPTLVAREKLFAVNVDGTVKVWEACEKVGASNFVFVSSSGVSFPARGHSSAVVEADSLEDEAKEWNDAYAESKAAAEFLIRSRSRVDGLASVSVRPNGIWGAGAERHHVPKLLLAARLGVSSVAFGTSGMMDWTHVSNLVHACILAHEALEDEKKRRQVQGRAFFVTDGWAVPVVGALSPLLGGLNFAPGCGYRFVNELTGESIPDSNIFDSDSPPPNHISIDISTPLFSVPWSVMYLVAILLETVSFLLPHHPEPFLTRADLRKLYLDNYYSSRRAKALLNYTPIVTPAQGMWELVRYYRTLGYEGAVPSPSSTVRYGVFIGIGLLIALAAFSPIYTTLLRTILFGAFVSHSVQALVAAHAAWNGFRNVLAWTWDAFLYGTATLTLLETQLQKRITPILSSSTFGSTVFLLSTLLAMFYFRDSLLN